VALAVACFFCLPAYTAESPRTNATPPARVSQPTNALASFRLQQGFRLELVAAEPLIAAPVAVAFDENGRLFVAEASGAAGQRGTNAPVGRVRLLEDTEGTGEYHASTLYADKLPWASALACSSGGVFVASGPDILFLKDSRTNGIADVRKVAFTVLTGTNTPNALGLPNNFNWALDNRIHSASAGSAEDVAVSRKAGAAPVLLDSAFSFDPRALTIASDAVPAQSGLAFDNSGRELVCDPTRPLRLALFPLRYRERNPFFPPPPEMADVASPATSIFRLIPLAARPSASARARGTNDLVPQVTNVLSTTWLTNAQGFAIYRGSAFPANYLGNAFIADPSAHVVHRAVLREAGLQPVAARAPDDARGEFLMSSDPSFRPVQVVNGPDGALYVVDAQDGRQRGRIYRIAPLGFKSPKPPRLGKARTAELVAMLAHPNGWHRDTAARLVYERRDRAAIEPLTALLRTSRLPLARLHALHALDGLGALSQPNLLVALGDADERVREHAVLLAEKQARAGLLPDPVWNPLRLLTADPSLRVRYQLALTLGELRQPGCPRVLADVLWRTPDNPQIEAAVFSSLANGAGEVFSMFTGETTLIQSPSGLGLMCRLATMIGVRSEPSQVALVVNYLGHASLESAQALPLVVALGEGLHQAGSSLTRVDAQGQLLRFYADASNLIFSSLATEPLRLTAIELLSVAPSNFTDSGDLLLLPLTSGQPETVQAACLAALGSFADPRVAPALLRRWGTLSPNLRNPALRALLCRAERAPVIMDALENGTISRDDVSSIEADLLRTDHNAAVAERAVRFFGPLSTERPAAVQRFKPALALRGSADHGSTIFADRCADCHQPAGSRPALGPELATARIYGKGRAFIAILEPGLALRPGYETCVIETAAGEVLWGILRDGNPTTVTLQPLGGQPLVLRRDNLPYLQPRSWSLMPERLEDGLTPQDLADLLAFVVSGAADVSPR
jgi:putative membrane-bound dehydrogenase-like protein